jgi:hypothetical protein
MYASGCAIRERIFPKDLDEWIMESAVASIKLFAG